MKRISPEMFRRSTGCSDGELRLLIRSPLTNYNPRAHLFDDAAARVVLEGIRQARREEAGRPRALG